MGKGIVLAGFVLSVAVSSQALAQVQKIAQQNLSPYGKPCLKTSGESRAAFAQPQASEHWVGVQNACAKRITGRICYQEGNRCMPFAVMGYGRENVFLGSGLRQAYFRFRLEEKVDDPLFR
jgi:hypothetical protein